MQRDRDSVPMRQLIYPHPKSGGMTQHDPDDTRDKLFPGNLVYCSNLTSINSPNKQFLCCCADNYFILTPISNTV